MHGSAGADVLSNTPTYTSLSNRTFFNHARYFTEIYATANRRSVAYIQGAAGNNHLEASGTRAHYTNSSVTLHLNLFGRVEARAVAGGINTKHVAAINYVLRTFGTWTNV